MLNWITLDVIVCTMISPGACLALRLDFHSYPRLWKLSQFE